MAILKMRLSVTRYLMAVLCMLAAGTWILPVHTLAAPAPAPAAPIDDGDETVALLALRDAIEAMRLAGEFDRAPFAFNGADLTGDGVAETIEVFPPQRLETPGAMRVVDGATGTERYTLRAPAGEMGFGDLAALVADCDNDGTLDIAVWSWLDVADASSPTSMRGRIRVVSGLSGELIGLLETVREIGSPVSLAEFQVVVAADSNLDGTLDATDFLHASAVLAGDAASTPTVDCKADGALTMEDLTAVIERVIEEPQSQRVALHSMALQQPEIAQPIAPPGSGVDPSQMGGGAAGGGGGGCVVRWSGSLACYASLGGILWDFKNLVRDMLRCPPAAPICLIANLCHYARFLVELAAFVRGCFLSGDCVPGWLEVLFIGIGAIATICSDINSWTEGIAKRLRDSILRGLRELGDRLGTFRI
jgi:hypothetical protein